MLLDSHAGVADLRPLVNVATEHGERENSGANAALVHPAGPAWVESIRSTHPPLMKALFAALPLILLTACASFTLFDATVTTTEVVKAAMTDWSELSVAGKTTPEIDAKVIKAHRVYQQSALVARDALLVYKNTGDQAAYQKAFEAAKSAMNGLLNIIVPLLTPTKAVELQSKAGRVTRP